MKTPDYPALCSLLAEALDHLYATYQNSFYDSEAEAKAREALRAWNTCEKPYTPTEVPCYIVSEKPVYNPSLKPGDPGFIWGIEG